MKFYNILNNFECEGLRAKVKVVVAISLEKKTLSWPGHFHLWTEYDFISHNILDQFECSKMKVTVAIFEKNIVIDFNFTQI